MKKEIEKIILEQTDQVKARMACELNRWQWPKELEQFKEDNHWEKGNPKNSIEDTLGWSIMMFIEKIVGDKAVSREWNKDSMTDTEFEKWYKNRD